MATESLITGIVTGTGAFNPACTFVITEGDGELIDTTSIQTTLVPSATGNVVIRVTSVQDPTKFDDVTVMVTSVGTLTVYVTGASTYSFAKKIYNVSAGNCAGVIQLITATVSGSITTTDVTFSIHSGPGTAVYNAPTFNGATGFVTDVASPSTPTVIRATSVENTAVYADHTITWSPAPAVESFDVFTFKYTLDGEAIEYTHQCIGKIYFDSLASVAEAGDPEYGIAMNVNDSAWTPTEDVWNMNGSDYVIDGDTVVLANDGVPYDIPPGDGHPSGGSVPGLGWIVTVLSVDNYAGTGFLNYGSEDLCGFTPGIASLST